MQYQFGSVGAGNMAEAIIRGAIDHEVLKPDQIIVADPTPERRELFASWGCSVTEDNAAVVSQSQYIMLAVKPQMLPEVADQLAGIGQTGQIIVSIITGVSIEKLSEFAGGGHRVIRVMPNTPLLVGEGMSAIAIGSGVKAGEETLVLDIFAKAGRAVQVDESVMDEVTVVSGSGPAYVFYLAEAMIEAGIKLGLDPSTAEDLTKQTIRGAARLLDESEDSPAELRAKVTSRGGVTLAATTHMDESKVKQIIADALEKGRDRSIELGR